MKISELLDPVSINISATPSDKTEAIHQAVQLMAKSGKIKDVDAYEQEVFARETGGTTGVGKGLAIPHGKGKSVKEAGLSAMLIPDGVEYGSVDKKPVTLLFLIAAPDNSKEIHLEVLSKLAVMLMDADFGKNLRNVSSPEEFIRLIDEAEIKQEKIEQEMLMAYQQRKARQKKILAVTSCPTGIAHTYMAADGLKKAAKLYDYEIKVETRGSAGAKDVLTEEEIEHADYIIVAADTKVPMARFNGKKVIQCPVSDGISRAEEIMEQIRNDEAVCFSADDESEEVETGSVHKIYRYMMNGVSHMLPFVVGGGILIALAFLIDGLTVDVAALTAEQRTLFGSITPQAALLNEIGSTSFKLMLPVLAGYIAMAIGDRPALAVGFTGGVLASSGHSGFLGAIVAGFAAGYLIVFLKKISSRLPESLEKIAPVLIYPLVGILLIGLLMLFLVEPVVGSINVALNDGLASMDGSRKMILGFILAAMMAVDMGGPVNKAAYVFGAAAITAGNYDLMAAVMLGGMCPPFAVGLASLIFKNRFTKEEQKTAPVSILMGLAFITEGAIPYAAADPFRVLPACIIGSGVAGAVSIMAGCSLIAPHGGIFVFPVVGHPVYYILAFLAGSAVTVGLLGVLKKSNKECSSK